jgi:hypothetical protein
MAPQCSVLKERMWRKRLDRYRQAGVSVAALCAAEGVLLATCYGEQRRLREAAGTSRGPGVGTPKIRQPVGCEAVGGRRRWLSRWPFGLQRFHGPMTYDTPWKRELAESQKMETALWVALQSGPAPPAYAQEQTTGRAKIQNEV